MVAPRTSRWDHHRHGGHAMPSAQRSDLVDALTAVPDPRRQCKNLRHALVDVLTIGFCGVLCGCEDFVEIAAFGQAKEAFFRPVPGGGRRARRLLGPEPVHSPLQARRRRHAGAVPHARKKRLNAASRSKKGRAPPLIVPHEPSGAAWSRRWRGPLSGPALLRRLTLPMASKTRREQHG